MKVLSKGAMVYNKFYGPHEQFWEKRPELISEHQVTMKYAGIKSPPEGRWFHLTSKIVPIKHLFILFRVSFFTHNRV
jgi:hypothetical protein